MGFYTMEEITKKPETEISISVVSHQQIHLIEKLLHDIDKQCKASLLEVLITLNLEESLPFELEDFPFHITVIRNSVPQGFAANHNKAFQFAIGAYFCVLNPDVRLFANPFPALIAQARNANVGLVAPLITNIEGVQEDSARQFPSPFEIVRKVFGGKSVMHADIARPISNPDWVAGMFMLFPRKIFQEIDGFDERYFLYYEDVDLCARLTLANYKIILCSTVSVVHDARRSSHKSPRYMRMHLTSMLRFFSSSVYRELRRRMAN